MSLEIIFIFFVLYLLKFSPVAFGIFFRIFIVQILQIRRLYLLSNLFLDRSEFANLVERSAWLVVMLSVRRGSPVLWNRGEWTWSKICAILRSLRSYGCFGLSLFLHALSTQTDTLVDMLNQIFTKVMLLLKFLSEMIILII